MVKYFFGINGDIAIDNEGVDNPITAYERYLEYLQRFPEAKIEISRITPKGCIHISSEDLIKEIEQYTSRYKSQQGPL